VPLTGKDSYRPIPFLIVRHEQGPNIVERCRLSCQTAVESRQKSGDGNKFTAAFGLDKSIIDNSAEN
jgi:hypothetical protein